MNITLDNETGSNPEIDIQKDLLEFDFKKEGEITIVGQLKHPDFKIYDESKKLEGNVYMWIKEIDDKPVSILYVGKAGKTIFKRMCEHMGGFKGGSKTGVRNATKLLRILDAGTKVGIYAKQSETKEIFGQEISLCEAEEKALIKRYKDYFELFNKI